MGLTLPPPPKVSLYTDFFWIKKSNCISWKPELPLFINVSLQVFMLALTFLVLFLGNFLTTLKVVHQKFQKNQEKVQKKDWRRRESDLLQRGQ